MWLIRAEIVGWKSRDLTAYPLGNNGHYKPAEGFLEPEKRALQSTLVKKKSAFSAQKRRFFLDST